MKWGVASEPQAEMGGRIGTNDFFLWEMGDGIEWDNVNLSIFLLLMKSHGSREMLGDGSVDIR